MIRGQKGFTIVEMMISLSVFATILLITAAVITRFNVSNRRALTQNTTQNTTRAVLDQVSQWVQFNQTFAALPVAGNAPTQTQGYCIGTVAVNYVLGVQRTTAADSPHAFVAQSGLPLGCGATSQDLTDSSSVVGKEYLGPGMRLAKFSITQTGQLYTIVIAVIYGDDDLLCSPGLTAGVSGSCSGTGLLSATDIFRSDLKCRTGTGSEYCAISELTTTVTARGL